MLTVCTLVTQHVVGPRPHTGMRPPITCAIAALYNGVDKATLGTLLVVKQEQS